MGNYDQEYLRFIRSNFDIRICDLDSTKRCIKKMKIDKLGGKEVDECYDWFLDFMCEDEDKEFIFKDQNEYADNNEIKNDDDDDEDEGVSVDENIKDPDYCLFLENLTEHGKSYKLKISQDDEESRFLFYEEHGNLDRCNDLKTCVDDTGDEITGSEDRQTKRKAKKIPTKKKISEGKKTNERETTTQPPHDLVTMEPCHTMGECKEEPVEYEKQITTSDADSDSDVVILDNVQNCSEVNNKQIVLADKEPSLREKLMHILMQPYNEREYKELSEYIEQEKPVSLLKPLRNGRSRLYANAGVNKRMLDYGPEKFQRLLNAAQNDPPKALNLLRMFRFWLEHVPNDDVFQPWREKQILKVRPSEEKALTHMQQPQLLLDYK